jgi:hypothetical protein
LPAGSSTQTATYGFRIWRPGWVTAKVKSTTSCPPAGNVPEAGAATGAVVGGVVAFEVAVVAVGAVERTGAVVTGAVVTGAAGLPPAVVGTVAGLLTVTLDAENTWASSSPHAARGNRATALIAAARPSRERRTAAA